MMFTLFFYIAAGIFLLGTVLCVCLGLFGKRFLGNFWTPYRTFMAGVFLAIGLLLYPIYEQICKAANTGYVCLKAALYSVQGAIQVFTADADTQMILDGYASQSDCIAEISSVCLSVLFTLSPILTVGFLLSFFTNAKASIRFFCTPFCQMYVFSELNAKSLTLARDIRKNHRFSTIVFAEVPDGDAGAENDDPREQNSLLRGAEKLKAICFRKDLLSIHLRVHPGSMIVFIISEEESRNVTQALRLREGPAGHKKNLSLFVFSSGTEGEMTLSAPKSTKDTEPEKKEIVVRRVDEKRSLIYDFLSATHAGEDSAAEEKPYYGIDLFCDAIPDETNPEVKVIHAVIVGLGKYGKEMLKALTWYCQMDGYRIEIDAFDADDGAESSLAYECPELLDPKYNGQYIPGEAQYKIKVHAGVKTETKEFAEKIKELKNVTFAFVAIGSDDRNIRAAVSLRILFEQARNARRTAAAQECKEAVKDERPFPIIQTVVYDSDVAEQIADTQNFKGQKYGIYCIGSIDKLYSEKVILKSETETRALRSHKQWGAEDSFYAYEYHYRSSMASAIHMDLRKELKVPGAEKKVEEVTEAEAEVIERIEHCRWNAYMRSEGYVYSQSEDMLSRNDLAKMHHNLVSFDRLSSNDKLKDLRVSASELEDGSSKSK